MEDKYNEYIKYILPNLKKKNEKIKIICSNNNLKEKIKYYIQYF